ncbi:GH32 C-terminal domain-containing protein [Caldicellulosiruptoraceae bacterium PP1]
MSLVLYFPFDEMEENYTKDKITGKLNYINYTFNEAKFKKSSYPERYPGVKGNALLFDGFSTWIEVNEGIIKKETNQLTIETWIISKCYEYPENNEITAIVNQHNNEKVQGFILGLKKYNEISFRVAVNGKWFEINNSERLIPLNTWANIVAVFNGKDGYMELYINGEKVGLKEIPKDSFITPTNEKLIIGKTNNSEKLDECEIACFCGLMDQLKIYDEVLDKKKIKDNYDQYIIESNSKIQINYNNINREIYNSDKHRPVYHLIAPGCWMNEPHAPLYFEGKYHIFYQHNPHGPIWRQIHWGHAISDDMIHWRDLPYALIPEKNKIDQNGCWSGSAFIDNGIPVLIYTAQDQLTNTQCITFAKSSYFEDRDIELKNWIKYNKPIILQDMNIKTDKGEMHYGHFRDPFVWKEDNIYYAIVGTGFQKNGKSTGGAALLYISHDLYNWEYKKPLYIGDYNKYPKTGEIWELPVFLPIGKDNKGNIKYILLINPYYLNYSIYSNRYVWYWIGSWNKSNLSFMPDNDKPELFDLGEHFTGPSGMIDPKGRAIIFSIAQGRRPRRDEYLSGWAHNGGLPIHVYLREDGRLGIDVISEIESLREKEYVNITNVTIDQANKMIEFIKDDCIEIELEIETGKSNKVGIILKRSPDGIEETYLYYKSDTKEVFIDRTKSTLNDEYEKGIQGGYIDINENIVKFHIYVDKSMIEAYINNLKAITSRVYPVRDDSLGLLLWADKNPETVKIKKLNIWKLETAYKK